MRIRLWRLIGIVLLSLTAPWPSMAASAGSLDGGYKVQPGDLLTISVWKQTDLQADVLVRPNGGLSFPLVGDLQAAGKTVPEIEKEIVQRLQKYIPDPVVSVALKKVVGNMVYVIGKVTRPGQFVMDRPIDVMQALSMAGGMTPYAADNDIKILRRVKGKMTAIPFAYGDVEHGENLAQDILLQSGDVVVVP